MATTTLDPNNTSSAFALSGGNLIATSSGAATAAATRPLTGLSYCSAVITTLTGTPAIGLISNPYSISGAGLLGATVDSLGYRSGGTVVVNAVTLATLAAFVQGDRIDVAINPMDRMIWFRVNNGNWNNNVANDPATGVGGIDYSGMTLSRNLVAVCASLTGAVWTAQFSTAFTNTPPTGFASIDNVGYTIARSTPSYQGNPVVAQTLGPAARTGSMPGGDKTLRSFSPAGVTTVVSGTCQENGSAVVGRRVDVYDRDTGELIGTTTSGGGGSWSVPAVGRPSVRIVGSDPTIYNSLVYDNVNPV